MYGRHGLTSSTTAFHTSSGRLSFGFVKTAPLATKLHILQRRLQLKVGLNVIPCGYRAIPFIVFCSRVSPATRTLFRKYHFTSSGWLKIIRAPARAVVNTFIRDSFYYWPEA